MKNTKPDPLSVYSVPQNAPLSGFATIAYCVLIVAILGFGIYGFLAILLNLMEQSLRANRFPM
jgi:hypothetical protein